ncbi:hypothetical protein V6N13_088559 [Hibiscus sabdariffa]
MTNRNFSFETASGWQSKAPDKKTTSATKILFLGPLGMPPVQPPPAYIGLVFAFVLIAIYVYLSHATK